VITTGDFKKGVRFLMEGQPYTLLDFTVQTPSARGAATLVRIKARHVISGQMVERTFKSGERFEEPDLAFGTCKLLYRDGEDFHFMDEESYDQFVLPESRIGESSVWLAEDVVVRSIVFNGSVAGIELPPYVELEIASVEPGSKSDTVSGKNLKGATLTNGRTVRVPTYIEPGERVRVDTRTGEFVDRVSR
jgi:elongation factor P